MLAQGSHVCAVDANLAPIGPVDAADQVEQGALAAAAVAQQGEELAGLDVQIDVLQHGQTPVFVAVGLGQAAYLDQVLWPCPV